MMPVPCSVLTLLIPATIFTVVDPIYHFVTITIEALRYWFIYYVALQHCYRCSVTFTTAVVIVVTLLVRLCCLHNIIGSPCILFIRWRCWFRCCCSPPTLRRDFAEHTRTEQHRCYRCDVTVPYLFVIVPVVTDYLVVRWRCSLYLQWFIAVMFWRSVVILPLRCAFCWRSRFPLWFTIYRYGEQFGGDVLLAICLMLPLPLFPLRWLLPVVLRWPTDTLPYVVLFWPCCCCGWLRFVRFWRRCVVCSDCCSTTTGYSVVTFSTALLLRARFFLRRYELPSMQTLLLMTHYWLYDHVLQFTCIWISFTCLIPTTLLPLPPPDLTIVLFCYCYTITICWYLTGDCLDDCCNTTTICYTCTPSIYRLQHC